MKDFFRQHHSDPIQDEWAATVVGRIEKEYHVRVRDASDVMDSFTQAGFDQVFEQPIGFVSTLTEWQRFANANKVNLYEGDQPIEWGEFLELCYRKPAAE